MWRGAYGWSGAEDAEPVILITVGLPCAFTKKLVRCLHILLCKSVIKRLDKTELKSAQNQKLNHLCRKLIQNITLKTGRQSSSNLVFLVFVRMSLLSCALASP